MLALGRAVANRQGNPADLCVRRRLTPVAGGVRQGPHLAWKSPLPQSTQFAFRVRRRFACCSSLQVPIGISPFTISPQFGQKRTVTTVRL